MNRIIISVTNDLVTDQRVLRTCECFNDMGFEILLIGRKLKNSLDFHAHYDYHRFTLIFSRGFLFYAEYNLRLFFKLLLSKKDLLFANDLDTLLPNYLVSTISPCKLIYDSHELFTEVPELVNRPKTRKFWLALEQYIFPKLKNIITVNTRIARVYQEKYGKQVKVIRNVPGIKRNAGAEPLEFRTDTEYMILYQGALNLGRGLELMIDAMGHLDDCTLVLAGDGDIVDQLKTRVSSKNLDERVIFTGRMYPDKLFQLTRQADLGMSLEEDLGLNYRYCLPNKVFDYIQAGIPILVSDLPLLSEIVNKHNLGETLSDRDPEHLASKIKYVIGHKNEYTTGLKEASELYNWEKERESFIQFIRNIE